MKVITENICLCNKTSLKIGGRADKYAVFKNDEELFELSLYSERAGLPVFIMGRGSNVLVSDSGWPGLVIDTTYYKGTEWDNEGVYCRCGTKLNFLVKETVERGFSSMACLGGIPGTLGGALVMNAGAFTQIISDNLEYVDIFDLKKKRKLRLQRNEMEFGYRSSSLKTDGIVVLGGYFRMDDNQGITKCRIIMKQTLEKRKEKQPLDFPSCGSVFKRPHGDYAGRLIDACGLKGKSIGDAEVSSKHANFIINKGCAGADEFRELVIFIQKKVFNKFGIVLEPEVLFIGNFRAQLFTID